MRAMRRIRVRRRWWFVGALIVCAAAPLVLIGCVRQMLPQAMLHVPNADRVIDPADDPPLDRLRELGITDAWRVASGPPEASLSVWVIEPEGEAAADVVVLHGIQDRKRSMVGLGRYLAARGYRAVLVDLRGHGRSSGRYASYGVHDRHDLVRVLDELERRGRSAGRAFLFGPSYGGAVALQTAAIDPRVEAVATVATFTRLRDIVPIYTRKYVPVVGGWVSDRDIQSAVDEAGRIAGFDPDEADNLAAIARTRAPVLLVHGLADRHIPPDHARRLHAEAPAGSVLLLVPDAAHLTILGSTHGPAVTEAAVDFFDEQAGGGR